MKQAAPKGTRDILPPQSELWQEIDRRFADLCERFQYGEIRIPTFEHTELFQRGVGDTTDIVQKEMYTFDDKAGRSLTLRPEGTAGVVRAFIEHGLSSQAYPVKLFYRLNNFRYENVQKGRYREFYQLGLEAFGSEGPGIDAEVISLLWLFFKELGLEHTALHLNSLGCPTCRAAYNEVLKEWYRPHLPTLCQDCQGRFERNPLRLLDCKVEHDAELAKQAPVLFDYLDDDCRAHFAGLTSLLDDWGIPYMVDKHMVRGLDYYTRTVFEFVSENVGTQGTIVGGGRYDGLVETLGGPAVPALGFAMGQERLIMELEAQGIELELGTRPSIYIASLGDEAARAAAGLVLALRSRGVAAATELTGRSFKAQMKYAGKQGFNYSLVLGDDELAAGTARLRNLAGGDEVEISLRDLNGLVQILTPSRSTDTTKGEQHV